MGSARGREFPRHQHALDSEGRDRGRAGSGAKSRVIIQQNMLHGAFQRECCRQDFIQAPHHPSAP